MSRIHSIDLDVGHGVRERFAMRENDPTSARAEVVHRIVTRRGEGSVQIDTRTQLASTTREIHLTAELEAFENGVRIFSRSWRESVARDGL
jgi:hypothetical protein